MARYVKKSEVIDAFQWDGTTDKNKYPEWFLSAIKNKTTFFRKKRGEQEMILLVEDGYEVTVCPGDFIIKKHDGCIDHHSESLYPFSKIYELI